MSEIVSAMAPCPWTYFEIAKKLSKNYIQNEIYKKWIQFYSSEQSHRQVKEIKMMLDALAKEASKKDKMAMKNYFATTCKYEYIFWEMAYNLGSKSIEEYYAITSLRRLYICKKCLSLYVIL
jgi:thiaminase (transcriptional activator TenA)